MIASLTIGVRPEDEGLRDDLDLALSHTWDRTRAVLEEAGVPLIDLPPPAPSLEGWRLMRVWATDEPAPSRWRPVPPLRRCRLPRAARAQDAEPLRIGAVLPIAGSAIPTSRVNLRAVAEAARMGLMLGEEDANKNGELMGATMALTIANAPGADAAARAAQRLVARDKVSVLVGGFTREEAEALSGVAARTGALFLNIGATSDALRHACGANTFHIEASAAMYLDALFGWFVRAGHRRWYLVHDDGPDGQERYDAVSVQPQGAALGGRGRWPRRAAPGRLRATSRRCSPTSRRPNRTSCCC